MRRKESTARNTTATHDVHGKNCWRGQAQQKTSYSLSREFPSNLVKRMSVEVPCVDSDTDLRITRAHILWKHNFR